MKKRLLTTIAIVLLLPAVAFAGWFFASSSGGAPVVPYFETDWSTNTPGSSDVTCAAAGGCSALGATWDEWDLNLGNGSVSGGEVLVSTSGSDQITFLRINNAAGNPFESFSATEWWVEFTFEISAVDNFKSSGNIVLLTDGTSAIVTIKSDASGNLALANIGYKTDSGIQYACLNNALSMSADIPVTIRYHYRKDSDGGADSGGSDGLVEGSITGMSDCSAAGIDSDTITTTNFDLNNSTTLHDGTHDFSYKIDNFKLYTSDPGW